VLHRSMCDKGASLAQPRPKLRRVISNIWFQALMIIERDFVAGAVVKRPTTRPLKSTKSPYFH
jgi:hypothetical protein